MKPCLIGLDEFQELRDVRHAELLGVDLLLEVLASRSKRLRSMSFPWMLSL